MFPAYKSQDSTNIEPPTSKEFLQNPSYDTIPVTSSTIAHQIESSSESESSDGEIKTVNDAAKYKKKSPTPPAVEQFYIDRERNKTYLKLDFLCNRAVPFYKVRRNFKRFAQSNKNGSASTFRRYFKTKRVKKLCQDPARQIDEKASKDEEMRIHLIKNWQDVDKWTEYIEYKVRSVKSTLNCVI